PGKAHPAFADDCLVAVGQPENEIVSVSLLRGANNLFFGGFRPGIRDVLGDAGREQYGLLQNNSELVPQVGQPVISQIPSIQQNCTAGRVVKTSQQAEQCSLSRAGSARDAYARSGRNLERDVVKNRMAFVIRERNIPESNRARSAFQRESVRSLGHVPLLVQNRKGAFCTD